MTGYLNVVRSVLQSHFHMRTLLSKTPLEKKSVHCPSQVDSKIKVHI